MTSPFTPLLAALVLAAPLSAQITYVDADTNTNTTLADGSPYTPSTSTSGTDNQWALRPFANGGTILSSHDVSGSNEDAPMLRTTISGLTPGLPYLVYTYWWGGFNVTWRGRALASGTQPSPQLPGYNTVHNASSVFAPMTPLAVDSPVGHLQTTLGLTRDAANFENSGHFQNQVMLQEGNRWLFEVPLGTHVADGNGQIHVYADDLEGVQSTSFRTWYDGVGYELAPLPVGNGCGSPLPQIGSLGQPVMTRPFAVTLGNAPANSLAMLVIGFSATSWNGAPLPFPLATLGFPGCDLNVAPDLNLFFATDGSGNATYPITVPALAPIDAFWQWGVLGPGGLASTTGLLTRFHR